MNYLTKEEILNRTDRGADIIISVYPNAKFNNKPFKIREEKTASARCKLINNIWHVTDFGEETKARNCFDILILEIPGVNDFKDALQYINENLFSGGISPAPARKKVNAPKEPETINKYILEFKKFTNKELDFLGIDPETAEIFNIQSLKSYTLRKEKILEGKENELIKEHKFESSTKDPFFAIDYSPEEEDPEKKIWKIYKPLGDKKFKFVYTGPRPEGFLYGFYQLPEEDPDHIIIAAGEKDVWNLRKRGFYAITLNSETAILKGEEYQKLKDKGDQVFVCYDIDETGQKKAKGLCEFYRYIVNIKLPADLSQQKDFRGSPCSDITDYFRHYSKADFEKLMFDSEEIYQENLKKLHSFYTIKLDKNGNYNGITIQKDSLIDLLMNFGFYSYDVDEDTSRFVQIEKNLIKGVNRKMVVAKFLSYIRSLPNYTHEWTVSKVDEDIQKEKSIGYHTIRKAFMNSFPTLFNQDTMLNTMISDSEIEIKNDIKTAKFFYFKNGWVAVSARGKKFYPYKLLDKYIWKDQILDREYKHAEKPPVPAMEATHEEIDYYLQSPQVSVFERFFFDITRNINDDGGKFNRLRYQSLKTIIGYNLHNYYNTKLYTTILTDAKMSEDGEPNGRTGKDLVFQFAGKMLNASERSRVFTEVGGKEFKIANKHRYELCNMETQFVLITDVYRNFNLEIIFPDITSGVPVNKKNDKPFQIKAKIGITANKSVRIDGESAKDRVIQFELSDHFNSDHSPLTKYGHWFGTEWDKEEWIRYDNFMIECMEEYFKQLQNHPKTIGIFRTESINLIERTLREHTSREFVGWFADKVSDLRSNEDYFKSQLFEDFTECYTDFKKDPKFNQGRLTKWINSYCKAYPEIFSKVESKRNGSKGDSFVFFLTDHNKKSNTQISEPSVSDQEEELVF